MKKIAAAILAGTILAAGVAHSAKAHMNAGCRALMSDVTASDSVAQAALLQTDMVLQEHGPGPESALAYQRAAALQMLARVRAMQVIVCIQPDLFPSGFATTLRSGAQQLEDTLSE